jgi:hypothetical protein
MRTIPTSLILSTVLALALPASTAEAPAATDKPQAKISLADSAKPGAGPATAPAQAASQAPAASASKAGPVTGSQALLRASGTPSLAQDSAETLDTSDAGEGDASIPPAMLPPAAPAPAAAAPAPERNPAGDSLAAAVPSRPAPDTVMKLPSDPALAEAPYLSDFRVGGTFQLKAFHNDLTSGRDADKSLSFDLRRARLDFSGKLGRQFGFEAQVRVEADDRALGADEVYLEWTWNEFFGIRGGKLKRPFSQEALQSSKSLFTVERGTLYQAFLADVNGYSSYDLGLVFDGGFVDEDVPVTYQFGVFNGKQSDDPSEGYADQHYQGTDEGLQAKDFVFRVAAEPFPLLKVEAAVATKAAEDMGDPANFEYHMNSAYQVGADFHYGRFRLLGEAAWGDNHHGTDARIVSGSTLFFAFYGAAVWHEDYSGGRASELVAKVEGVDPDFEPGSGEGTANDGKLRYTLGTNYFFTPRASVLVNYSILHPVTEVAGEDELTHDLAALWRLSF